MTLDPRNTRTHTVLLLDRHGREQRAEVCLSSHGTLPVLVTCAGRMFEMREAMSATHPPPAGPDPVARYGEVLEAHPVTHDTADGGCWHRRAGDPEVQPPA